MSDLVYFTGDAGRYRPDGVLEILGRLDDQLKIRGQRIEPAEIEARLAEHPAVAESGVVACGPATAPRLVACVVARRGRSATAGELRRWLGESLPAAMVPSLFDLARSLPRSPNGKLDRAALRRRAEALEHPFDAALAPPRSPAEEIVAGIFGDLLELGAVGRDQDFFALGGHSLLAMQLVSRLRELGRVLPVRAVFEAPSVAELAERIEAVPAPDATTAPAPPEVLPRTGPLPLSFAQRRLWFLDRLDPGGAAYNIALAVELEGHLDAAALEAALGEIVRRHEILRSRFTMHHAEPRQVACTEGGLRLPLADLENLSTAEGRRQAHRLGAQQARRGFDLERGPLLRALLVRRGARRHVLFVILHHIAADGWSTGVLLRELGVLYQAGRERRPSPLPKLELQVADFAGWQRRRLTGAVSAASLDFWRGCLEPLPPVLELPTDRPRPALRDHAGGRHRFRWTAALTERIQSLGRRSAATLFMTLLTAFQALLSRLAGQWDLALGTPVAGRDHPRSEVLIGCFVNTLVVRTELSGRASFERALARMRDVTLEAYAHRDLPFDLLVDELRAPRQLGRTPLFSVMLVFQNVSLGPLELPGLRLEPLAVDTGRAKFDLNLSLALDGGRLTGSLEYARELFDASTAARWCGALEILLESAAGDPRRRLAELPLCSPAGRHQVLTEWNDAPRTDPQQDRRGTDFVPELFAAQVRKSGEAVALTAAHRHLSYRELERATHQLGRHLRRQGVGAEMRVAVALARTPELVISLLAVLEAGGAYLPLELSQPPRRQAALVRDAAAVVLLTAGEPAAELAAAGARVVRLDRDRPAIEREADVPIGVAVRSEVVRSEALAYVIYTSGSTGRPKGVLISHGSLARYLRWAAGAYAGGRSALLHTSPAVDLSVTSLFVPLVSGRRVVLVPEETGFEELTRVLGRGAGPGLLKLTPSHLRVLGALPGSLRSVSAVRNLVLGGEALTAADLAELDSGAPDTQLFNEYGPTEVTVACAVYRAASGPAAGPIPVGRPMAGARVDLLDDGLRLAAPGTWGEMCLGGTNLARGYLDRPAATAGSFVPDPFSGTAGARLYRSGDLGRARADGNLVFVGRRDHQLKIRGHRIEPGEIEAALTGHPAVEESIVVACPPAARDTASPVLADQRLVAYVVYAVNRGAEAAELRRFLRRRLPAAMVPAAFVALPALPLSAAGKVDRSALPEPRWGAGSEYVAPAGELEEALAEIWCRVLGSERVGVDENFFDLGGHSLLMVTLQEQLRRELAVEVTLVELFQYPSIRRLAEHLVQPSEDAAQPDTQGAERSSTTGHASRSSRLSEPPAIAIVGMAGRFPGAVGVEELWQNLRGGVESISRFSTEDLLAAGHPEELVRHPRYVPAVGAVARADHFDAEFFGVNPREAEVMDPQHRLFLECAFAALEDAGYGARDGRGSVGVFAGTSLSSHLADIMTRPELAESVGRRQLVLGNDKDFLPTRVAYKLDLKGPGVSIQTACSTSLVAVHLACRSLLEGECDLALAGGSSISLPVARGYLYEEGGILSPVGRCRAFDAGADGTVGGNGTAVVALKRLEDAVGAGDDIYAVIRGTAINNDGADKVGYTAPSVDGQAAVIAAAHDRAGIDAGTVGYVEAHGTGTRLGDPIEVAALTQAFRRHTDERGFCALGSVKTNVGHLDTAAGVTGLIKAALALKHGEVPPSLHFERPNPQIDFASGPFFVNTQLLPWPLPGGPRRAGVSSFGIGGTNAHAVLEEAPRRPAEPADEPGPPWHLLVLSAKTADALERRGSDLRAWLERHPEAELADVAYTLQVGRERFEHRRAVVCRDRGTAVEALAAGRWLERREEARRGPVAFLFPGLGPQQVGMGKELYRGEEVFRRQVDHCSRQLEEYLGLDLRAVLYPTAAKRHEAEKWLHRIDVALPALFTFEYAMAQLWISWGARPEAMLGHSNGEYVAACLAGVFDLNDALMLVAERSRLMARCPPGAMSVVPLPPADTEALLGDTLALLDGTLLDGTLALAAVNGPQTCIVSGTVEAVEALEHRLAADGLDVRRLAAGHAYHSPLMASAAAELAERVASVELRPPRIPYLSNVTGTWIEAAEAVAPEYWARHLLGTVRFATGLERLSEDPDRVLLEVGPGATLGNLARPQATGHTVLSSLSGAKENPEAQCFVQSAARLWLAGVPLRWDGVHAGRRRRRIHLPAYPFAGASFSVETCRRPPVTTTPATTTHDQAPRPLEEWTYLVSWKPSLSLVLRPARPLEGCWLVFEDDCGLGRELAGQLCRDGCEVVTVRPGERFERLAEGVYQLPPAAPEAYRQLFDELTQRRLRGVVHLWTVTAAAEEPPADQLEQLGFYSLLRLADAIAERIEAERIEAELVETSAPLELAVISNGLHDLGPEDRLQPSKALVLAWVKGVPQELEGGAMPERRHR